MAHAGSRCGTGSASGTAGRSTPTRSASSTTRRPARPRRARPGGGRSGWRGRRWSRCGRSPAPCRGGRRWAAVARLEGLCADAWPARVDGALGAWRLRAAGGLHRRGRNSRLARRRPRDARCRPALDAVRAFAAEHGVPPRVQVPDGLAVGPGGGGARAGCSTPATRRAPRSRCWWRTCDRLGAHPPRWRCTERPDDAWWAARARPGARTAERGVLDPGARRCRTAFGLPPGWRRRGRGPGGASSRTTCTCPGCACGPRRAARARHRADGGRGGRGAASRAPAGPCCRWRCTTRGAGVLRRGSGCVEHHRYRYLVPPDSR